MIQRYLWLFVILLAVGNANTQQVCTLRTFYNAEGYKGSWSFIGAFELPLEETYVTKSFQHKESGVDISVRVDRYFNEKNHFKEPNEIQLAISLSGGYEAEAESIYDKHWKSLSVSNKIKVDNRIYTFALGCEKMNKKNAKFKLDLNTRIAN